MKKHRLNHVVVGEMRVLQRSHENVMNQLLQRKRSGGSITKEVAHAQRQVRHPHM